MKPTLMLFFGVILITFAKTVVAQNPIVTHRYLADPGALVYDGRVYLYMSNDDENSLAEDAGYDMRSIVCVSSSDLVNWTDHGRVLEAPEGVSWTTKTWAPSPVERNGKFYLYFGNGGSAIGVAVSDSPTGPFVDPLGESLVSSSTPGVLPADGIWIFDPMTFIDDDGQAYMYFGGNGEDNMRLIRLNEDMISVDGEATSFNVPYFFEAAWMHKYEDTYYFSYSTNPSNSIRIDYMTSDNPTTGFTYGGVISNNPPNNQGNNNHQAIFEYKDVWYQAYHNRVVAIEAGINPSRRRNLNLDSFTHGEDGSINLMDHTTEGVDQVGYFDPYNLVEAETINIQEGIETVKHDSGEGLYVTDIENGDYIRVRGVDFGDNGAAAFTAKVASDLQIGTSSGGTIEIVVEDETIGIVPVSYTGGMDVWKSEIISVKEVTGVHDVYFYFKGGSSENLFNFDQWQFIETTNPPDLIGINATISKSKIDTAAGTNTAKLLVSAVYSDGSSEDVTTNATFSFSEENIVGLSDSTVTGLNFGEVTITSTFSDSTDSVKILVKELNSELTVTQIDPEISNIGLFTGTTAEVVIIATFADGHKEEVTEYVTYDNPNPEIATISDGVVKGLSAGEVEITISYEGDLGGEKTTTVYVTVTEGLSLFLEAECGSVGNDWEILSDTDASNGYYVTVQAGTESISAAPSARDGLIIIDFTLSAGGDYSLYARLNNIDYDDDSFWIQMNSAGYTMYNGLVTSGWEWVKIDEYTLEQGEHTISIGYREDGALMDKLVFTNLDVAPENAGNEAVNSCKISSTEDLEEVPGTFNLEQNYPNPFNPTTVISYQLPRNSTVLLQVFDTLGREVSTLVDGQQTQGHYSIDFNASELASGVYFYTIEAGDFKQTKRMLLVK